MTVSAVELPLFISEVRLALASAGCVVDVGSATDLRSCSISAASRPASTAPSLREDCGRIGCNIRSISSAAADLSKASRSGTPRLLPWGAVMEPVSIRIACADSPSTIDRVKFSSSFVGMHSLRNSFSFERAKSINCTRRQQHYVTESE
jgi:hypothetical protein